MACRCPRPPNAFGWSPRRCVRLRRKNPARGEDLSPYFALVERHALPIRVIGGIWCAGRDEAHVAEIVDAGARFGSTVLNCQLHARHASGHPLSDREVADFYLRTYERGEPAGCLPSLEVHVDMWARISRVSHASHACRAGRRAVPDHARSFAPAVQDRQPHRTRCIGHPRRGRRRPAVARPCIARRPLRRLDRVRLGPACACPQRDAEQSGQPVDAPRRRQARARDPVSVRCPAPGTYHGAWRAEALDTWKAALRQLLHAQAHAHRRASSRSVANSSRFPTTAAARAIRSSTTTSHARIGCDTWHAVAAPPAADVAHTGT